MSFLNSDLAKSFEDFHNQVNIEKFAGGRKKQKGSYPWNNHMIAAEPR